MQLAQQPRCLYAQQKANAFSASPIICARRPGVAAAGHAKPAPAAADMLRAASSSRGMAHPLQMLRPRVMQRGQPIPAAITQSSGGSDDAGAQEGQAKPFWARFTHIFTVFSDPRCNTAFLALAIGQMLCSIATLIHDSYLPVYMQDELGLSNTKIGAVQGAAQFLCQLSKGVSGVAGDVLGSQVRVLVFGTALTLACKPMFAMLSGVYGVFGATACVYWFFSARLLDRLSKGIREAPTKAVMNELARESGDAPDAAYGLRQSLATAGMLIGSTIAAFTFAATGRNYIATFAVASVPPLLALLWMVQNFRDELFGDRSPNPPPLSKSNVQFNAGGGDTLMSVTSQSTMSSLSSVDLPPQAAAPKPLSLFEKARALVGAFKPVYWQALAVVAVLYIARFDASFLSLRAKQVMDKAALPMLTLVNTLIQVVLTAPLARFSGTSCAARNSLLVAGFAVMVAANACFASPLTANPAGMFVGAALLGTHMALTHSITVSMVASYMPTGEVPGIGKISGTAVSFTDLLLGFVLAGSNTLAGVLSDATRAAGLGNVGCFMGGASACMLAAILLLLFSKFGDLGNDALVVRKGKKAKAT